MAFANDNSTTHQSPKPNGNLEYSRNERDGAKAWIVGALEIIGRDGVDTIRIGKLASEIGISKGSFYWFFNDLRDLLICALNYWKTELNDAVFDHVGQKEGCTETRLFELVDTIFQSKLGRYDAAIRSWALKDDEVRTVVRGVDCDRLGFLTGLFQEQIGDKQAAKGKAHLFYRAIIAESYLGEYPADERHEAYLKSLITDLLQTSGEQGTSEQETD